jgi:predicted CopG family antitoxin
MSAWLVITIDDDLYTRLKKKVPPQQFSAYITEAVRAKLRQDAKALNVAYRTASKEQWRAGLAEDWKHID